MAMSVVPAPMSTRHTPSSRSSSVSTDLALATAEGTSSSTERPQRWMHLEMFCTAAAAPVTKCTEASRRTPLMPTGERMPSWPSMRYSCDSLYKTLRSAGIATALAASSTWSRSPGVTSRSRIAAVPCELRVSRCEPEIDAYTERMSQPAINSASSTARWIECTVDSMSTTAPFFMPRETCEPSPITSTGSPGRYSPTIATTFEVPMSRPTTRCLSLLRFMGLNVSGRSMGRTRFRIGRRCGGRIRPLHRETVAVAQVGVDEAAAAALHQRRHHRDEARQALFGLVASDDDRAAAGKPQAPGPATGKIHRIDAQMESREFATGFLVEIDHVRDTIVRPGETGEVRYRIRVRHREQPAVAAEQPALAPVRERVQFQHAQFQHVRPALARFDPRDPRQRRDPPAHAIQIQREESGVQVGRNRRAQFFSVDMLEFCLHLQPLHRPAVRSEPALQHADQRQRDQCDRDQPGEQTSDGGALHAASPSKLVSSTRQHSVW